VDVTKEVAATEVDYHAILERNFNQPISQKKKATPVNYFFSTVYLHFIAYKYI